MISFGNYVEDNKDKEDRWQLLFRFMRDWRLRFAEGSPYTQEDIDRVENGLGFKLPRAVSEWYLLPFQPYYLVDDPVTWNYMIHPMELKLEGQYLPVFVENQGGLEWAISKADLMRMTLRHM